MNNVVGMVMAVTVSLLVIGSILASTVSAFSEETCTYTNDGVPYAAYDGEEHTIIVSYDGTDTTITTDGETCENPDFSLFGFATIVYGSDAYIRLDSYGHVRGFSDAFYVINATSGDDVTIVLSSDTAVMTNSTVTKTVPITTLAYISSEGDYVLCSNPCVTNDTVIIAGTTTISSSVYLSLLANGSIDDLTAGYCYCVPSSDSTVTVSSVTAEVNTSEVTSNLVQIDSIVFTATLSDETTQEATYTYFLAPAEITYDNPQYIGSAYVGLLSAIMVMVIIAVLMLAVRGLTRYD